MSTGIIPGLKNKINDNDLPISDKFFYVTVNIGTWEKAAMKMSSAQKGEYMCLYVATFQREGRLKSDPDKLYELSGSTRSPEEFWADCAPIFEHFVLNDEGYLECPAATKEYQAALQKHQKNVDAATEGVRNRRAREAKEAAAKQASEAIPTVGSSAESAPKQKPIDPRDEEIRARMAAKKTKQAADAVINDLLN